MHEMDGHLRWFRHKGIYYVTLAMQNYIGFKCNGLQGSFTH